MQDKIIERYYGKRGAKIYDLSTRWTGYLGYYKSVIRAADLPRCGRSLDVGCGTGMFTAALHRCGNYSAYGIDIAPATLRYTLTNASPINLYHGDVFAMQLAKPIGSIPSEKVTDHKYDVVVSAGMIEYVHQPGRALELMIDMLTDDGALLLTTIRDNFVGRIASKLYNFRIISDDIIYGTGANVKEIHPFATYPNIYLRTLKRTHLICREAFHD